MAFPSPEDRLFQWADDVENNACVGPIWDDRATFASNFRQAAEALAVAVSNDHAKLDSFIYPIVYLYRQSLELTIKDLICCGKMIERAKNGGKYPVRVDRIHDLPRLWEEAKALILAHVRSDIPPEIDNLDGCIKQFHEIDPSSFAFRYSTDRPKEVPLNGLMHINIRHFFEVVERVDELMQQLTFILNRELNAPDPQQVG